MKKVKIFATDFWSNFDLSESIFYKILSLEYEIEISENEPDLLFYSVYGSRFLGFNCKKIFFTGESIKPNFNHCDYALSYEIDDYNGRNFRFPLYLLYDDPKVLTKLFDIELAINEKTKFCNFVYSNPKCNKRNEFFRKLSKYKNVDSGGRIFNNIGGPVIDKQSFIKQYKFSIAFENMSHDGYTTEKIFEPLLVHSIPIYWGNKSIHKDFNPKRFLNYYDYKSEKALIERIIEIDNSSDLYAEYLKEPCFHDNIIPEYCDNIRVLRFFKKIIETDIKPVSNSLRVFSDNTLTKKIAIKAAETRIKFDRMFR